MYVELLRRSNISPCKQYSKWVLTFLVVLPKLILTIGALNGIEPNQHNQYFQEKIYSIFSPYCSLVVRAEKEFSLCLPGTGDWESASSWRQTDVFHEKTPRKWISFPSFVRETSDAWRVRIRTGQTMKWAGMLPMKRCDWRGRGERGSIGNMSPCLSCFHSRVLLWIVTGMKWEVEDGPGRKFKVCSTQQKQQQFQGKYSHVRSISRSHICKLGSGCTSYLQKCLT